MTLKVNVEKNQLLAEVPQHLRKSTSRLLNLRRSVFLTEVEILQIAIMRVVLWVATVVSLIVPSVPRRRATNMEQFAS